MKAPFFFKFAYMIELFMLDYDLNKIDAESLLVSEMAIYGNFLWCPE